MRYDRLAIILDREEGGSNPPRDFFADFNIDSNM
jgi:hypothetical protein